jgi:hypothetical protein
MNHKQNNIWYWLTLPLAVLIFIAAGGGVFFSDLYHDTTYLITQAVAQDLATLVIALPTLVITAVLAVRGSAQAHLVWLGVLIYILYTYIGYAFAVKFNILFLVYVGITGCATYALIGGLATTDFSAIKAQFDETTPTKALSIFFAVIAVLFYFVWLSDALPASLADTPSQELIDSGTPTNFIHVLDMAFFLPALLITAVLLWRHHPVGYTLAGALLTFQVIIATAILSMVVYMVQAGDPISVPLVVIFGTLFVVSLGLTINYLRHLQSIKHEPQLATV